MCPCHHIFSQYREEQWFCSERACQRIKLCPGMQTASRGYSAPMGPFGSVGVKGLWWLCLDRSGFVLSLTHMWELLGDPDREICHRNEPSFHCRTWNFRFLSVARSEMLLKCRHPLKYWDIPLCCILSELLLLPVPFCKRSVREFS